MLSAHLARAFAGTLCLLLSVAACDGTRGPVFVSQNAPDAGRARDAGSSVSISNRVSLLQFGGRIFSGADDLNVLAQNISVVEDSPFDGIVLDIGLTGLFATRISDRAKLEAAAAVVRGTSFRKFTTRLQRLNIAGSNDFFSDTNHAAITQNLADIARLLRDSGITGLMLDTQNYGSRGFSFTPSPSGTPTFAESETMVRKRGYDIGSALYTNHPRLQILVTIGYAEVYRAVCLAGEKPESTPSALLPAFLDGLAAARQEKAPQTGQLIDAFLSAYSAKTPGAFRVHSAIIRGNDTQAFTLWTPGIVTYTYPPGSDAWAGAVAWTDTPPSLTCSPALRMRLQKPLSPAFGLMLDYESTKRGGFRADPAEFSANYHSPEGFGATLAAALAATDRYVWIWTSTMDFWSIPGSRTPVPPAYLQAISDARMRAK